jgi:hypothetical protein
MGKTIAAICILLFISIFGALYTYSLDFSNKKITNLEERNDALNFYASKAHVVIDSNRRSESKEFRAININLGFKERRYLKKFFEAFPSDAETFIELFEFNELAFWYKPSPWVDLHIGIRKEKISKTQDHKQYSLNEILNALSQVIPFHILFAKLISIGVGGATCSMNEESHALQEFLMQSVEENEEVLKYIITDLNKRPDEQVLSFWYFFYADWHPSRYIDYYNNLAPKLPFRLSNLMGQAFWYLIKKQTCCRYCGEIPPQFSIVKNPQIVTLLYNQIDEFIVFYLKNELSERDRKFLLEDLFFTVNDYLEFSKLLNTSIATSIKQILCLDKKLVETELNSWVDYVNIEDGAPAQITYFIKKLRADVTNDKNREIKK